MVMTRFAMNVDGNITECAAREDQIGKGRCNHIAHQLPGESVNDFILRAQTLESDDLDFGNIGNDGVACGAIDGSKELTLEDFRAMQATLPTKEDINTMASRLMGDAQMNRKPNYMDIVQNTYPWPFSIGTPGTENYVHADITDVSESEAYTDETGTVVKDLTVTFDYNGKAYPVNIGSVPVEDDRGCLRINGVDWRYVPVISQWKTGGAVVYAGKDRPDDKKIIALQEDNHNIAFTYCTGDDFVKAGGVQVPVELAEKMIQNPNDPDTIAAIKKATGTNTDSFVYCFKNLNPVAVERFDLTHGIKHLDEDAAIDAPNDLSYRKCYDYASAVEMTFQRNLGTMGTTFRRNYTAGKTDHLFISGTFSKNLKDEVTSRNNLQFAEELNPISEMSQRSRLSWCGGSKWRSEGWNRDGAPNALRYPHPSHKGLIDPLDVCSGKNVGLTTNMSQAKISKDGYVVPDSTATAVSDFIPYIGNDDPSRAAMGVAHMKQACPIVGGEDPKVSTPAWNKIHGAKLGCNLTTAYVPFGDGVFEDSVVISESAAKKMATIQSVDFKARSNGKYHDKTPAVGDWVKRGAKINGTIVHCAGFVSDVKSDGTVTVQTMYSMGVGDKLSNRHGNKGVVSRVLPDSEMPMVTKDGKTTRADVIYSPLSIASRANMGQVMEANNGNLEKKSRVTLRNGKVVDATAGEVFIMRLNHIADKKLSAWANEKNPDGTYKGHRLGSMEGLLLTSTPDRQKVLNFIRNQEGFNALTKMQSIMKSVGINMNIKEKTDDGGVDKG